MKTRGQRHLEGGTPPPRGCAAKGKKLHVGKTGAKVKSLTDDPSSVDDDGTDHRVGTRGASALCRKAKRQGHVPEFLWAGGHRFLRPTRDRRRPDRADVVDFSPFLASASANA